MIIGVPKEIKNHEYRVGLVPSSVDELVRLGHDVMVETNAGLGIGFTDSDYQAVGATIGISAKSIFDGADLIIKVKEPQLKECQMLRPGQLLFTYLHLAPDPQQTEALLESGCTAIAYETVTDQHGQLPLLSPMSEVAGRMSIQAAANCSEIAMGGRGVLLGGVPGVPAAKVVVIGGGMVGTNAVRMAIGMEADVTVLDRSLNRLRELDLQFGAQLNTVYSTRSNIEEYVIGADVIIGAVLVPGAAAPKLVTKDMLKHMHKGTVMVDVAIDQGGCFETSRPTTHSDPTFVEEGVVHYCVTNMPGAVPRTAAFALNNATLPFIMALAGKGLQKSMSEDPHFMNGLNVHQGRVTYQAVAQNLNREYCSPRKALNL